IYHWLIAGEASPISLKVIALLALAVLYYAIFRAVFGTFRWSGLAAAALVSVLFSLLVVPIFLPDNSGSTMAAVILAAQYVVPTSVALVMTFGLSWSHI